MSFSESPEFSKELKRYSKKYRSLGDDLKIFKTLISSSEQLEAVHFFQGSQATKLIVADAYEVVKARLDCADLGNKQMLRVTYIQAKGAVILVELYSKNEKPREDMQRVQRCIKSL